MYKSYACTSYVYIHNQLYIYVYYFIVSVVTYMCYIMRMEGEEETKKHTQMAHLQSTINSQLTARVRHPLGARGTLPSTQGRPRAGVVGACGKEADNC